MKALVLNTDGDAPRLEQREIADPVPSAGEVLVQVAACGICHHDVAVVDGALRRGVKPGVVLGHEVSGVIAEVGEGVESTRPGDRVVAALTAFCGECARCAAGSEYRCLRGKGFGHALDGGFAQFMKLPQSGVIPIPDSIDLVQAALLACPIGVAIKARGRSRPPATRRNRPRRRRGRWAWRSSGSGNSSDGERAYSR